MSLNGRSELWNSRMVSSVCACVCCIPVCWCNFPDTLCGQMDNLPSANELHCISALMRFSGGRQWHLQWFVDEYDKASVTIWTTRCQWFTSNCFWFVSSLIQGQTDGRNVMESFPRDATSEHCSSSSSGAQLLAGTRCLRLSKILKTYAATCHWMDKGPVGWKLNSST